jgi:5,10-methylenetetrahydromethanopterin reductase
MHHGVLLSHSAPIDEVVEQVRKAEAAGFDSAWSSQLFDYDALTLLAVAGRAVPRIALGTAVVPVHPRHPIVLASQALTVQAALGGRLTLGIGLSHQIVVEGFFGYSFERPYRYMREYLAALAPLLRGEGVHFDGEVVHAHTMGPIDVRVTAPRLLLAALGSKMLELAGAEADGTVTWMVGPETLRSHIVPTINRAAEAAARPAPAVAVGLPVCVTDDPATARQEASTLFAIYGQLPSYRAMLDRESAEGPADVAVVGDEEAVSARLDEIEAAGATEFQGVLFGGPEEHDRTFELLASRARAARDQTSGQG